MPYQTLAIARFEDFRRVMAQGWVVRDAHYALHGWHNPAQCASLLTYGFVVPKRLAKRAVRRNLIKRQMRQVCLPALVSAYENATHNARTSKPKVEEVHKTTSVLDTRPQNHNLVANQFVIRLTRGYDKKNNTTPNTMFFTSASSDPLSKKIQSDLLHLLHKTKQQQF